MDSNQICTNMDNIFQVAINTKLVFSQRGLLCALPNKYDFDFDHPEWISFQRINRLGHRPA